MNTWQIINGDCLGEMAKIDAECADLIFADPPYWMRTGGVLKRVEGTVYNGCDDAWDNAFASLDDYNNFTRAWLAGVKRLLKINGSLWVIGSMQCIYSIGGILQEMGFWLINDVVWWKNNPTPNMMGTRLCNAHETLIWAVKDEKAKFTFHYRTGKELNRDAVTEEEYLSGVRKQLGSVWRFPVCGGGERIRDEHGHKLHSTQKPYALLHRIVNICSNVNDLVIDPFGGTFTTGAAALASGRNFIGIEANERYCEYGRRRLGACQTKSGPVEMALYDVKPPKITLREMLARGFLRNGEKFFVKSGDARGVLRENGEIALFDGAIADIHGGAALATNSRAARLNGFNVWHVRRGDRLIRLDKIREKARANDRSDD